MMGRTGRVENIQLIVLTLAILLYLLIQVAESADRLAGPSESPDQPSYESSALASVSPDAAEGRLFYIVTAAETSNTIIQAGVQH